MMLWGGVAKDGALELRREENGGIRLRGRFPYASETMLATGRAEQIAPRAFAARIEAGADIHLLSGHDYEKPLASRAAGTLTLRDTDAALEVEAVITPDMAAASWARDFLAAQGAGLIRGLSPGFRVPPGGEVIEKRGDGLLRTVRSAELFELSAVTVPAYPDAQIEARNWQAHQDRLPILGATYAHNRWRV